MAAESATTTRKDTMSAMTVDKPWIPFDDFLDHVNISLPVMNIAPEVEYRRAGFAEAQGLSLLLAIGDHGCSASDRARCAVGLAKLSAKVVHRKTVLQSILNGGIPIQGELRESIEKAIHLYWVVAKMANLLHMIRGTENALAWAVRNSRAEPKLSEKKRICPPWRSSRLTDKMSDRYRAREVFALKLWEMRFPVWMKIHGNLQLMGGGDPKNPDRSGLRR